MAISLEEMKNYLRVDFEDDDELIAYLISSSEKICSDILREDGDLNIYKIKSGKAAVMYTVAYLYEHREKANHEDLTLTLRALLFSDRKAGF